MANSPVNNFSRSLTKDSSSTRRKTSSKSKVKGQSESRHKKQLSSESELGSIKKQRGRSPRKSRDKSESESKYQSSICPVVFQYFPYSMDPHLGIVIGANQSQSHTRILFRVLIIFESI